MLGPKIDARLNTLERKLVDLTHRIERLEAGSVDAHRAEALFDEMCDTDTNHQSLRVRVAALEDRLKVSPTESGTASTLVHGTEMIGLAAFAEPAKKRRGRPPKAKNG